MSELREVAFPERIIDRHVGGNTTYARHVAEGLIAKGIRVGRIPSSRSAPLTALAETREGLRARRPGRVLHYSADTGPLITTRQPSLVTVHGVASRWISTARTPRQEKIWRLRVQRAISSTDSIVTVSKSSADDVSHVFGVDPALITTIHHGIDADRFRTPCALPDRFSNLDGVPYALYLGNIEPRKNLIELVSAFQDRRIRALGVRLVIAGKPAWNADESMRAIMSGSVDYLGFVGDEERTALMQHAALFVFPSLYEGFGFPVLEAMAAGAPVLTSTRGSLAEVAGPALTVEDLSRSGIADAIVSSLSDSVRLSRSREEGAAWVARFSWDESVRQHLQIYSRLVAR